MQKHRLIKPLEKELNKGKNLIFFFGMNIDEEYYFNYINGTLNSTETFRLAVLNTDEKDVLFARKYIEITSGKVKVFEKEENKIIEITEQFFEVEQPSDVFSDEESEKNINSKNDNERVREVQNSQNLFKARLLSLNEKLKENEEEYFIYFDKLEWIANLYSTNRDEALDYIKYIKDWSEIRNKKVIVNIIDKDLLKEYHFPLENNTIYIGNPSGEEILKSYLRKYLSKTVLKDEKMIDLIKELKDISYAMSSSNKTMKEAMRVYDNVVRDLDYKMDKKDFEIAIEKISEEKVFLSDVVLDAKTKKDILAAIDNFLSEKGGKSRKGLILTGAPGTGKTFIVKALANEKNCYFLAPSLADLKGEYVGQTSGKIKRIFEKARANQPTILFIDEADTIFTDRNLSGTGDSDSYNQDMVNQFLVEIDGLKTGEQKIFVIAATNRLNRIDEAIKSRLSESLNIPLPGLNERKEIFAKKLEKYNYTFRGKAFQNDICAKTNNMSGRDIDNFVKKIIEKEGKEDLRHLNNDDNYTRKLFFEVLEDKEKEIIEDLKRQIPSIEIMAPESIETHLSDIIGYENLKKNISRLLSYLKDNYDIRKNKERLNIKNQYGILLYGPPGNGKTKIAEAIAKEENLYFIKILSKDFVSNRKSILENISSIFEKAKRLSKITENKNGVLLFFDEFDSLASSHVLSNEVRGTLLDYLASENEIRNKESKVVFMAATNFFNSIDEAVKRKGRIDKYLEMQNPNKEEGKKLIRNYLEKDGHILLETITEQMIEKIYKLVFNAKQKDISRLELINKMAANSDARTLEFLAKLEDNDLIARPEIEKLLRPSGADLKNIYIELKNKAYYCNNINKDGKIVIDEKIIDSMDSNYILY